VISVVLLLFKTSVFIGLALTSAPTELVGNIQSSISGHSSQKHQSLTARWSLCDENPTIARSLD
jgi:hypothetical protein